MSKLLIPGLTEILKRIATSFFRLVGGSPAESLRTESPALWKLSSSQSTGPSAEPDLKVLNCRVQLTAQEDAFTVEICGSIHATSDMHYAIVQISIADITDGIQHAQRVHSRLEQWQMQDSPVFIYNADLGKLPNHVTTLSDWVSVASLNIDWMIFPRKGERELQFSTSILSRWNGQELACATSTFAYENPEFGYIDLQENGRRTKKLAVALAFAVSAADNKLFNCEVELIKNWARKNIGVSRNACGKRHPAELLKSANESDKAKHELDEALDEAVTFFRNGNQLDTQNICEEIVEIAPLADRYDTLDLCLRVAQADGVAAVEELNLLKNLASWLEVDKNRFREMMAKILPAGMHEVKDVEVILGVTSDMGKDKTRKHLNKEYSKWNARVTNTDSKIQNQADDMLRLIADTRSEYIG
jgi:hypothetical protein